MIIIIKKIIFYYVHITLWSEQFLNIIKINFISICVVFHFKLNCYILLSIRYLTMYLYVICYKIMAIKVNISLV